MSHVRNEALEEMNDVFPLNTGIHPGVQAGLNGFSVVVQVTFVALRQTRPRLAGGINTGIHPGDQAGVNSLTASAVSYAAFGRSSEPDEHSANPTTL